MYYDTLSCLKKKKTTQILFFNREIEPICIFVITSMFSPLELNLIKVNFLQGYLNYRNSLGTSKAPFRTPEVLWDSKSPQHSSFIHMDAGTSS